MIFRLIVTAAAVLAVSATPLQRLKRATQCRVVDKFVGGTWSDNYHEEIESEEKCIELCKGMDNCTAVNYFHDAKVCLPQVENMNTGFLESRDEEGVNYVIVKGCQEDTERKWHSVNGRPGRRRRSVQCREVGKFVAGTVIGGDYIMNITTEQECIDKCKSFDNCKSINFFSKHSACLAYEETLADPDADRIPTDTYQDTVYVIVRGGCDDSDSKPEEPEPQEPARRKREVDANCKLDDILVGGSVVIEKGYIDGNVPTLEACIEECQKLDECNAVNYWAKYGDCLPQRETLASEEKDSLSSRVETGATYVVVKNCNGKIEKPANILPAVPDTETEQPEEPEEPQQPEEPLEPEEPQEPARRKRDVDPNCKLDDILVGGPVVTEKGYIDGSVKTLEACIEECQKLDECLAVNYWAEFGDCLPQGSLTLASEDKHRLSSREEAGTTYVVVKNCNVKIEKPANILPPVTNDESDNSEGTDESSGSSEGTEEKEKEETEKDVDTGDLGDPNPELPSEEDPYIPDFQRGRKKRDAVQCRQANKLVGGEIVGEVLMDVKSEEDCIAACKELDQCQSINYFPAPHNVCWRQAQSVITDPELETRDDDLTNYVIVKGCEDGDEAS